MSPTRLFKITLFLRANFFTRMINQTVSEVSRRCVVVVSLQRQGDEHDQNI